MAAIDYIPQINNLKKPTYESPYNTNLQSVIDNILSSGDFSYDFAEDPAYKQYKNEFLKLSSDAAQSTVSQAAGLTGGYGNSYSVAAASQANQQHLSELNNIIPQLMSAAMQRHQMEKENLYKNYSALAAEENRAYEQYRNDTSDYYADQDHLMSSYQNALEQENLEKQREYQKSRDTEANRRYAQEFEYQKGRDTVSDTRWEKQLAYQKERDTEADRRYAQEFEYQKSRDTESDKRYAEQFAYQQSRDLASDEKWRLQTEFEKARALVSDEKWQKEYDYKKSRDSVADSQWDKTFEYNQSRDKVSDSQWQENFNFKQERAAVSDEQWQKEFDLKQMQQAAKKAKGSGSGSKKKTTSTSNESWMTEKDAKLALTTLQWIKDEDQARKFTKKLVDNGTISASDGNWIEEMWKANIQGKPTPVNSNTTPMDIIYSTANIAKNAVNQQKEKGKGTRVETKNGYKLIYVDGKLVQRIKL